MKRAILLAATAGIGLGLSAAAAAQSLPRCIGPVCLNKSSPTPAPRTSSPSVPETPAQSSGEQTSGSGQYAKNGRACVDSLCLGDGIDALEGIEWKTAIKPGTERDPEPSGTRALGRGDISRVTGRYRGEFQSIIGYLADGQFDNGALAGLKGVTAACESQSLVGKFTSAGGNETLVIVSMVATPGDPDNHRWEIRRITRYVPNAVGPAKQAAQAQLDERYSAFRHPRRAPADDMLQYNDQSGFAYTLSAPAIPNVRELMRQHTACGGAGGGPVSID